MTRATLKAAAHATPVDELEDRKLSTKSAARYLDKHPTTLRKWRRCNEGPAWHVTEGGNVVYTLGELRRWSEGRRA